MTNLKYFVSTSIQRQPDDVIGYQHLMVPGVARENKQDPKEFQRRSGGQNPDAVLRHLFVRRFVDAIFLSDSLKRVQNVVDGIQRGGEYLLVVAVVDDVT